MKKVNKKEYDLFQSLGGYWYIAPIDNPHPVYAVYGGDPAWEDGYNEEYMQEVFDQWGGLLDEDGKLCLFEDDCI